jgi:hypothetical protein
MFMTLDRRREDEPAIICYDRGRMRLDYARSGIPVSNRTNEQSTASVTAEQRPAGFAWSRRERVDRLHFVVLIATAIFALVWAIARAKLQSITIDEADTYFLWVAPGPSAWHLATVPVREGTAGAFSPNSNNHILNSLLIRFFTSWLGLSPLTIRIPALIGATLYIGGVLFLSGLITSTRSLRLVFLVCLIFNPFFFDFYVAARGYSLALAFLTWAVAIPAAVLRDREEPLFRAMLAAAAASSLCVALSFTANFSFAFADAAILFSVWLWMCYCTFAGIRTWERLRQHTALLAAVALPGLLLGYAFCGSTLRNFPKSQLFFGATSTAESLKSVIGPTLYELNPRLLGTGLTIALTSPSRVLLPLIGALAMCCAIFIFRERAALRRSGFGWQLDFALVIAGSGVFAFSLHWFCFRLFGVLLPRARTAMYLVLFATLVVGLITAVPVMSKPGRTCRGLLASILFVMAVYFVLCLRLTHFQQWQFDSECNRVFQVAEDYGERLGVKEIPSHWFYVSSLNFYARLSGRATTFYRVSCASTDKRLYVLYYPEDQQFIRSHGLRIVFHGQISDVVVALKPGPGIQAPLPTGPEPMRDPAFFKHIISHRALEELNCSGSVQ